MYKKILVKRLIYVNPTLFTHRQFVFFYFNKKAVYRCGCVFLISSNNVYFLCCIVFGLLVLTWITIIFFSSLTLTLNPTNFFFILVFLSVSNIFVCYLLNKNEIFLFINLILLLVMACFYTLFFFKDWFLKNLNNRTPLLTKKFNKLLPLILSANLMKKKETLVSCGPKNSKPTDAILKELNDILNAKSDEIQESIADIKDLNEEILKWNENTTIELRSELNEEMYSQIHNLREEVNKLEHKRIEAAANDESITAIEDIIPHQENSMIRLLEILNATDWVELSTHATAYVIILGVACLMIRCVYNAMKKWLNVKTKTKNNVFNEKDVIEKKAFEKEKELFMKWKNEDKTNYDLHSQILYLKQENKKQKEIIAKRDFEIDILRSWKSYLKETQNRGSFKKLPKIPKK